MAVDSSIIVLNRLVSSRATMGGMTMAAAIIVTPNTSREATMAAASTSEKIVSIQPVGTP